jgi:hypothetical protein
MTISKQVAKEIDKYIALQYYARKKLKGKLLKEAEAVKTNDAMLYTYFKTSATTTRSRGSTDTSTYNVSQNLAKLEEDEAYVHQNVGKRFATQTLIAILPKPCCQ